jgi:hypothetical protein
MQKNSGNTDVKVYLDGSLVIIDSVTYAINNFDSITTKVIGPVASSLQDFSVRKWAMYPFIPFTSGPVTFVAALGDSQSHWNSYVLI